LYKRRYNCKKILCIGIERNKIQKFLVQYFKNLKTIISLQNYKEQVEKVKSKSHNDQS